MNRVVIRDVDKGWRAVRQLADLVATRKPHVVVGVTGEEAAQPHHRSKQTVVGIAVRHEFGIGVPQRSFVRATFDANREAYRRLLTRQFREDLLEHARTRAMFDHRRSRALNRLGLKVEGDIKRLIAGNIPPPLSPRTLKAKGPGKTTALVDTSQMRGAITFGVRP